MPVGNTAIKKEKTNVQFAVTGSQVTLTPKPKPQNNLCYSYRNYPMRRSISAFGFQSNGDDLCTLSSRPLSADNIRCSNKKDFKANFSDNETSNSVSTDDYKARDLSENEFENIINGYSETRQICQSENIELKPGLPTKPPLPFHADSTKSNNSKNAGQQTLLNESQNLYEQEAFDEIIALKFQRWFPDSVGNDLIDGPSSENNDNFEVLSYRENQFQSCEYRYEIKKNRSNKILNSDKKMKALSASKSMKGTSKKINSKVKEHVVIMGSSSNDYSKNIKEENCKTEREYNEIKITPQITFTEQDQLDSIIDNNKSLKWLEEQDLRLVEAKQSITSNDGSNNKLTKKLEHEPKIMKSCSPPLGQANVPSKFNEVHKKSKKITFQDDLSFKNSDEPRKEVEKNLKKAQESKEQNSSHSQCVTRTKGAVNQVTSSPPPQTSQLKDTLLSMANNQSIISHKMMTPDSERSGSMFNEIVDILKDIENEDIKNGHCYDQTENSSKDRVTSSAKAIWSLIEEAERSHNMEELSTPSPRIIDPSLEISRYSSSPNAEEPRSRSRLSDLLRYPSSDLAQKVMTLQLVLDEKENTIQNMNSRFKNSEQAFWQKKEELQSTINKQNRLIEQLKVEKKTAVEKLQSSVKDLERKQNIALQNLEERYKTDLKRSLEKQSVADKMEREKWMESQSKQIKDKALKSLEPELNRMAAAHEETVSDIHKFYKRQLTELEETLNRRIAVQKEKMEAEKEKALAIEREMSRQKLEDEISELEKRYQDQRKRLLAEVHVERETLERANEASLAIKEKENERKWEIKSIEMGKKIEILESQYQDKIAKLQQSLETEKQLWLKNQAMEFLEKENRIKEQYKKERDKHIEQVIHKLESENSQKELSTEQKLKRLKEQYETEIHDVENANETLRRKLNDNRSENQKCEEIISQLRAQFNQVNTEYVFLKEKYDRLISEQGEFQNIAKSELSIKLHVLQSEINQTHLTYESKIKSMKGEHERELIEMYNRVREMITRKDDLINSLKMQKDAALAQCNQLEKLLDLKCNNASSY